MGERKHLTVACIPAYNEERTIATVLLKTMRYVDKVIVCDDGSFDMTGEIAERLGAEVIRHARNMGYGAALRSLFKRAAEIDPDVMVTLDADSQHSPEDVRRLVEPVLNGEADIVIGSRLMLGNEQEMPGYRRVGVEVITKLARAASYDGLTDAQSGFRAYSRRALKYIIPTEQGMGASAEILLKAKEAGLRIKEVPIRINYDVEKPSTHNPISHGLDVVLSIVKHASMTRPLLFYGVPGGIMLVSAAVFWVWTFQIFATTRQILTNIALLAIGTTLFGLILLSTAVMLWVLVSVVREGR
ncbi:MAG: glycosyltransferase family 2 protein [Candidatus Methanomethylicia archaeon]|nr:glycosyltransferase family 2 protein [Candidatus Methanomethylicia archaeon]